MSSKILKRCFFSLALQGILLLATAGVTVAQESTPRFDIPNPAIFLTADTVSLTVIKATPEDQGFKSLFDTAWKALGGAKGAGSNVLYRAILARIQGDNSNVFSSLLPAQFVRVDSLDDGAEEPHPTTATTISGWHLLQQIWFLAQLKGDDGKDFPKTELDDATLILRDGYENPASGRVLTRFQGTILSFPTPAKAKYAVERFVKGETTSPNKHLAELLSTIDTSHDTYGILLNRRGSIIKLLRWLNKYDVARAEEAVGQARMKQIMDNVESMTWEGNLVSDDEAKFILRFRTTTPEARKELTTMLKDVRTVLDSYGRAGTMETSGLDNELYVNFEMKGYRDMLVSYIERNF